MPKTIKRVIKSASIEAGHAIEIELELGDSTRETLRCEMHNAPNLVQGLMQAAAFAEKQRKTQPKQPLQLEMPYRATGLKVGVGVNERAIATRFSTTAGVPVVIAMSPNLARVAIARIAAMLETLDKQPPERKN